MVVDDQQERIMALARDIEDIEGGVWSTAFMMTDQQLDMEFWFKWHVGVHQSVAPRSRS